MAEYLQGSEMLLSYSSIAQAVAEAGASAISDRCACGLVDLVVCTHVNGDHVSSEGTDGRRRFLQSSALS